MNTNEWLEVTRKVIKRGKYEYLDIRPELACADGFHLSVQASHNHACSPRSDSGPYFKVEVAYPSSGDDLLEPYYDDGGVYNSVPVSVMDAVIAKHGGIKA